MAELYVQKKKNNWLIWLIVILILLIGIYYVYVNYYQDSQVISLLKSDSLLKWNTFGIGKIQI